MQPMPGGTNIVCIIRLGFPRSIAQPGSAPGLGPGGRKFESYYSDHRHKWYYQV